MTLGAGIRPAASLVALQLTLAWARATRSASRGSEIAGLAAGWLAAAVSGALLCVSAAVFCVVAGTLLHSLLVSGRGDLAFGVAGAVGDAAILLTVLAVVLSDPLRSGIDPRPLSTLPLSSADHVLAELVGLMVLHPAAIVLWSASATIAVATYRVSPYLGLMSVPACSGLALSCAAAALVMRRLVLRRIGVGSPSPFPRIVLATIVALTLIGWLVDVRHAGGPVRPTLSLPLTPGAWLECSLRLAEARRPSAIPAGLALHAVAVVLLIFASRLPWSAVPIVRGSRLPRLFGPRPAELARIWSGARAAAIVIQGYTAAGIVFLAGTVLAPRVGTSLPVASGSAVLAAWVLASMVAPISANALGIGGRAAASIALVPASGWRLVAISQLGAIVPALAAAVALIAGIGAVYSDRGALALAAGTSTGLLAATFGVGGLLSTVWPRAHRVRREGDPLWVPGPTRLLMAAAHGAVLLPAIAGVLRGVDPVAAALRAALVGLMLLTVGAALAARRLDRRRWAVTEALLR